MNIFKKKKQLEPDDLEFYDKFNGAISAVQEGVRSYITEENLPHAYYYGKPISLDEYEVLLTSGSYAEYIPYLGTLNRSSGTSIIYQDDFVEPLKKFRCEYCGQTFLFDERQIKSVVFTLSCPSCGARIK